MASCSAQRDRSWQHTIFTVNLSQRPGDVLLVEHIELLRNAVGTVLRYVD
jgi:hypothetical protein